MLFTKYCDIFDFNNKHYLFNTNNGALIELDDGALNKVKSCIQNGDSHLFSNDEINILTDQEFLVGDDFDIKQININKLNYNISKYSLDKDSLKIDFALTNLCNFNCPYCFECESLNKEKRNETALNETAEEIFEYIQKLASSIKNLTIVYYGGEPTLENDFILKFNKILSNFCKANNINYKYNIITNGFLLTEEFVSNLNAKECDFIQVTIDGNKEFHNSRRTNLARINTFDVIVSNVNNCLLNNLKIVIRLNVDKQNFDSIIDFLENIEKYIDKKYFGNLLFVDIARVFGSKNSYNLLEYENYRAKILDICVKKKLIIPRIGAKNITTFCIAESLSKDLVIDYNGNIYRCWNNVFDSRFKINTIKDLLKNNLDPYELSNVTLNMVEKLSLNNVNGGKCLECKYLKYCQGLCPKVRENILNGTERNIYENSECEQIIYQRLLNELKNKEGLC